MSTATDPSLPQLEPPDRHNRLLRELVSGAGHRPPEPTGRYNLVVVGAGTAGLVTAAGAAGLGARVALVERELLGGDCLNVGCVPSKALISCARAAAGARKAAGFGVKGAGDAGTDFPAVMERMRRLRAEIGHHDSAERFQGLGVDVFFGPARFRDRDLLEVGGKELRFARACIATGTSPVIPPIKGLEQAGCLTNRTLFSLTELPPRMLVVGGGPIGCEMAQTFARFGSRVVLLEAGDHVLSRDDPEAAALVEAALRADGVELMTQSRLDSVKVEGGTKHLEAATPGGARTFQADALLVAVGRSPNVKDLGLEAAGVAWDPREGVRVDDRLRTSNPRIYAAGDVATRFRFTHAADALARIVVRNALFFGRARAGSLVMPWCTYTDPELAHVGPLHQEIADRGDAVLTFRVDLSEVDRAVLDGAGGGFLKVHTDRRGRLLGGTLVAPHAGDMISELTLAVRSGCGLKDLSGVIHPYPTQAEVFRKAGDAYMRSKLRPGLKRILERYFAWRR